MGSPLQLLMAWEISKDIRELEEQRGKQNVNSNTSNASRADFVPATLVCTPIWPPAGRFLPWEPQLMNRGRSLSGGRYSFLWWRALHSQQERAIPPEHLGTKDYLSFGGHIVLFLFARFRGTFGSVQGLLLSGSGNHIRCQGLNHVSWMGKAILPIILSIWPQSPLYLCFNMDVNSNANDSRKKQAKCLKCGFLIPCIKP